MTKPSLRLIALALLTLIALVATFGALALFLAAWLALQSPPSRRLIPLAAVVLLTSGAVSGLLAARGHGAHAAPGTGQPISRLVG